jgi:hypothetical protein
MSDMKTLKAAKEVTKWNPVHNSKLSDPDFSLPAVKTCPVGSKLVDAKGSSCENCYATSGNYIFDSVWHSQNKRLEAYKMTDRKEWIDAMVFTITKKAVNGRFRWFGSGDLFERDLLLAIVEIADRTPGIRHWLPTKQFNDVLWYLREHGPFPENLFVRVSSPMVNGYGVIRKWRQIKVLNRTLGDYVTFSVVSTGELPDFPDRGLVCPSVTEKAQCGVDCQACFANTWITVNYPEHTTTAAHAGQRKVWFKRYEADGK